MRDDPRNPIHNENVRLLEKRAWLNRHIEKAMRKRRYPHIVHEDDELPRWKSLTADIIGGLVGGALMLALLMAVSWVMKGGRF